MYLPFYISWSINVLNLFLWVSDILLCYFLKVKYQHESTLLRAQKRILVFFHDKLLLWNYNPMMDRNLYTTTIIIIITNTTTSIKFLLFIQLLSFNVKQISF